MKLFSLKSEWNNFEALLASVWASVRSVAQLQPVTKRKIRSLPGNMASKDFRGQNEQGERK